MAQAQLCITQYREMEVKTADQFELVLLLYKGAGSQLKQAKQHIAENNIERRIRSINKAAAMIGELQAALDFEKGGQIAASLGDLYSYMLRRLSYANAKQSVAPIEEVIRLLATLQSAWEQARFEHRRASTITQLQPPPQMAVKQL